MSSKFKTALVSLLKEPGEAERGCEAEPIKFRGVFWSRWTLKDEKNLFSESFADSLWTQLVKIESLIYLENLTFIC